MEAELRGHAGDEAEDDAEAAPTSSFSHWDVWDEPSAEKHLRDLPSVTVAAIRFVWGADRRSFLIAVASDLVAAVVGGLQVLVIAALLNRLLSGASAADAARAAAPWVVVLVAAGALANLMNAHVRGRAELFQERVGYATGRRLLAVASNVDLVAFESPAFFDRLQRVQTQAQFRPVQVVQSLTQLLSGLASSVGVIVALAVLQPWLVPLVVLAYVPVMIAMNRGVWSDYEFVRVMTPLDRRRLYISMLLTDRESAKEVRALGLREFLLGCYDALSRQRMDELAVVVAHKTSITSRAEVASAVLNGLVIGSLLVMIGRGGLSVATAGAALSGLLQLRARFGGISYGAAGLYEAVLFLVDQRELLALAESLEAHRPTEKAPMAFRTLSVEDVSFTYPDAVRPAVDRVTLDIHAGEVIALVGENGSGKTTLAKLMAHLYQPSDGRILWDGVDVHQVDGDALRQAISVVFQDFEQYHLTVAENIGFGDISQLDDRDGIAAAAARAGADRLVDRLPNGYDTILGRLFEGGQDLSIGQWQRIALARAFFREAPFVILDEPTAALDARAEHHLFQRIRSLFAGRTVMLISHRSSTVRSADRIYVLHHGRITESGTHAQLMEQAGTYAELFNLQASAFLQPTPEPTPQQRPGRPNRP